jgi:hypothetical protein
LLRQRFLVDPLEDLLLFVHESRQSLVLLHLWQGPIVIFLSVDLAENVLKNDLQLLHKKKLTYCWSEGVKGNLFLLAILG